MGYPKAVHLAARDQLIQRKNKAKAIQEQHHQELAEKFPELLHIERAMAQAGLKTARAMLNGGNAEQAVAEIAKENLALQAQRREMLRLGGYADNYLDLSYTCPYCKDEGFIDGHMCQCQKNLLRHIALEELKKAAPIDECTFETFQLDFYPDAKDERTGVSPRFRMGEVLEYCRHYAADFSKNSKSLFMYGETGLGKTHLSLSIAQWAVRRGYGVVYGSAQNLLSSLEQQRFGRSSEGLTEQELLDCDLLILDDLGAEFTTQFTISIIYNLINTRLLTGKPVIISTNLSPKELEDKYAQRITSRIIGNYVSLRFCGRDVRQLKRKRS